MSRRLSRRAVRRAWVLIARGSAPVRKRSGPAPLGLSSDHSGGCARMASESESTCRFGRGSDFGYLASVPPKDLGPDRCLSDRREFGARNETDGSRIETLGYSETEIRQPTDELYSRKDSACRRKFVLPRESCGLVPGRRLRSFDHRVLSQSIGIGPREQSGPGGARYRLARARLWRSAVRAEKRFRDRWTSGHSAGVRRSRRASDLDLGANTTIVFKTQNEETARDFLQASASQRVPRRKPWRSSSKQGCGMARPYLNAAKTLPFHAAFVYVIEVVVPF